MYVCVFVCVLALYSRPSLQYISLLVSLLVTSLRRMLSSQRPLKICVVRNPGNNYNYARFRPDSSSTRCIASHKRLLTRCGPARPRLHDQPRMIRFFSTLDSARCALNLKSTNLWSRGLTIYKDFKERKKSLRHRASWQEPLYPEAASRSGLCFKLSKQFNLLVLLEFRTQVTLCS